MKADSRERHPFVKFNEAMKRFFKAPKAAVEAQEKALHEERSAERKKKRAVAS